MYSSAGIVIRYAGAYPGEGSGAAESTALPNDWRRFLDLADELGARDGVDAVVKRWALAPDEARLLDERAAARTAYASLVDEGGTWAAPDAVRHAMDAWRFGAAEDAMHAATTVLERRDEVASLASEQGLEPPVRVRESEKLDVSVQIATRPGIVLQF